jgi:hypothetical protein
LTDAAFRLHVEAIAWCARNLMDGYVPADDVSDVATARRPYKLTTELVVRGLWHLADERCDSEKCPAHVDNPPWPVDKGWLIHDYFDYQPSKEKVREQQKAKSERQARWMAKKRRGRDASQDASIDAAPPRPEKSGGGGPRAGASGRAGPPGPAVRAVPDWCGQCDNDHTRLIELGDGTVDRCPTCHPRRGETA